MLEIIGQVVVQDPEPSGDAAQLRLGEGGELATGKLWRPLAQLRALGQHQRLTRCHVQIEVAHLVVRASGP